MPDDYMRLDVEYHDTIGDEYDRIVVEPRRVLNDHLFSGLVRHVRGGSTLLDLGTGTGHATLRFGPRFGSVVAVDHSRVMLEGAARNFQSSGLRNVTVRQANVIDFMMGVEPGSVDAIACIGFLHHLADADIATLLARAKRALRRYGQIVLSEPRQIDPASIPPAIAEWNAASIAGSLTYAKPAQEPQEHHLSEPWLLSLLLSLGFTLEQVVHSWEIFPHGRTPDEEERARMVALHEAHGHSGNVLTVLAYA